MKTNTQITLKRKWNGLIDKSWIFQSAYMG